MSAPWRATIKAIQEVLLHEWDPIGIRNEPGTTEEYDGYAIGVFRQLQSGVTPDELSRYLETIEAEMMGLSGPPDRNRQVAERLLRIPLRQES